MSLAARLPVALQAILIPQILASMCDAIRHSNFRRISIMRSRCSQPLKPMRSECNNDGFNQNISFSLRIRLNCRFIVFHAHFWGGIALHKRYPGDAMQLHLNRYLQRALRVFF
ncbi:hypothetical protein [Paraburkholderia eburnea]|uniref:hypothetical protein n=1 Tax=Paraburkholderia eburnea TaxID=1189126 RepID=UPI001184806B|nr:hypothetical protein [Paraburkholderia eburnea]